MQRIILGLVFACVLFAGACTSGQQGTAEAPTTATPGAKPSATPTAQPQIVTATVEEARLAAGGAGEAVVRLDIAEGWHVNANPPSDKFYIGTEVQAEAQGGVTPGKPAYPPALTRKFEFSPQPLAVYEGQAVVKLPLKAAADAAKGRHTFRARIRYQPCNNRECLQPRTVEAYIPVTVS